MPKKELITGKQARARWKYLSDLAQTLNEHGIDQALFIDHLKGWEIPITKEFLHEIWKIKQKKMFLSDSSLDLETDQVAQVYDAINNFTSTQFGVSTPFPSEESLVDKYDSQV